MIKNHMRVTYSPKMVITYRDVDVSDAVGSCLCATCTAEIRDEIDRILDFNEQACTIEQERNHEIVG